jgi:hypothetical protein
MKSDRWENHLVSVPMARYGFGRALAQREFRMKKKGQPQPSPEREGARQRLSELRLALLTLHKALVDSERVSYEKTVGTIPSPSHFLRLLTQDPWFAWLQPFEPLTLAGVDALVRQTRLLLAASESGEGFSRHYFDALQRDPDVVMAHADAARHFGLRNRSG